MNNKSRNSLELRLYSFFYVVPKAGFEPARVSPLPPQDSVSTKFHHFGNKKIVNSLDFPLSFPVFGSVLQALAQAQILRFFPAQASFSQAQHAVLLGFLCQS